MASPFIDRRPGSRYERPAVKVPCERCGHEHYSFASCVEGPPEPEPATEYGPLGWRRARHLHTEARSDG
jgi:hypothetical protein